MPATLANGGYYGGGHYQLHAQEERQAADGTVYRTGIQSAEWTWAGMGTAEWDWWMAQYARGSAMPFELWRDDTKRKPISFTSGWLLEPKCDPDAEAGMYMRVKITITHLMPLLAPGA